MIELLVVISLIAVLLSISLVASSNARKSSRDGKRKADLEQIRSALEIYRNDCRTYPLDALVVQGGTLAGSESSGSVCLTSDVYMESIPSDPLSSQSYVYIRGSVNTYVICASLENGGSSVAPGCSGADCGGVCNYAVTNP